MSTTAQASVLQTAPKPKRTLGARHFQVSLSCLATMVSFSMSSILSVAVVAMVDKENANPDYPEYDWNMRTQSLLLSANTWGFFVLQLPGGVLAEKFKPRVVMATAQFMPSIFCVLTPLAAATGGWGLVFACRFMQGLFQGMMVPAIQVHLAQWAPVTERGVLVTSYFTGSFLGTVLAMSVGGVLCTGAGGWPSAFYVLGGLGLAWTVLWMWLGSNTPAEDRYISVEERAYIEDSLRTSEQQAKPASTPWRAILTSVPVWAGVVATCGWGGGYWLLVAELPTFLKTVLGFDIATNGFLSALPYLLVAIVSCVCSVLSDFLNNRKVISLTFSRKLFNSIGFFIPAIALFALCYSTNVTLSVVLLNVAIGVGAATAVGYSINNIDLAPNFAGTLLGMGATFASFIGCLAPLFVGAVVTESGSEAQWQVVFFVIVAVYVFAGTAFLLFGRAEQQPWNDPINSEYSRLLATAAGR